MIKFITYNLKIFLLVSVCSIISFKTWAQSNEIKITGKVTDESNAPLFNVSVKVKGQTVGMITDVNGVYSIKVPTKGDVLVFSYIGYISKEQVIEKSGEYNVSLYPRANALDEIVVVGYGTVKRKDLTGSVGSVNMRDLEKAPVASFQDALAGRVAGVQVTTTDGQPGDAPTIIVRGANSVTQDNSPLYVIDGFPMENFSANTINPGDIESIEILKDASATAIYGARGANGVVILTTKKGKAGPPVITFQNWYGVAKNIRKIDMMSPYDFVKYQSELNPTFGNSYMTEGRDLDYYRGMKGIDWQDLMFQTAGTLSNSVSIAGGTDKTKYSISGSSYIQDGTVINSGFNRYAGRIALSQVISPSLKVDVNASYTRSGTSGQIMRNSGNSSSTSYTMYSAWGFRPVAANPNVDLVSELTDPEIDNTFDYRINPVINLNNLYNKRPATGLFANAALEYKFLKDFTFRTTGGMNANSARRETFYNSQTSGGSKETPVGAGKGPNGSITYVEYNDWVNENTLTFKKTFAQKHNLDMLTGFTIQGADSRTFGYSAIQLPNEILGISGLEEGILSASSSTKSMNTLASFLARVNYGFDSRYLLTASFRADGSSKFPVKNRWSFFPSASAAWVISQEKFMENLKSTISNAKFRVGYGTIGNNRVSDFGYLSQILQNFSSGAGNTRTGYSFNNVYNTGAAPWNLGNPELKWETTRQLNIGLDLELFKNRISLVTDYYYKNTHDLLLNATMAPTTGYRKALKNVGEVSNEGLEFTLNTINVNSKNFNWSSSFNIAFNRNRVLKLNENEPSLATAVGWSANYGQLTPYLAKLGKPIAMMYGYIWDGVYQLEDFTQAPNGAYTLKENVSSIGNPKPGYIKYRDINGDGKITSLDMTVIGNPNPVHIGGFSNNFKYKNFDLNIFFQWSYGNDIFNANRIEFEGQSNRGQLNMFASYADRWSVDNQGSTNAIATGGGPNAYSDRVVEDGSFLRLKTIYLSYNIPNDILKKYKIKGVRIYTSAQNLITWTNYSGLDPEVSTSPGALTPGFDFSPYPKPLTITAGLNATF